MYKGNKIIYFFHFFSLFLLLLILHAYSHFIPFERLSIGPDDYAFLFKKIYGIGNFLIIPDRPLQHLYAEIQNFFIGDNYTRGFFLIFFSSFLTIITTFIFLNFFFDKNQSFFITIIYSLFYSKLEIFHTPIFSHINVATSIYIICLIYFILFTINRNKIYLLLSYFSYLIAIFWYEVGIFTPIFLFLYIFLNWDKANKLTLYLIPFFIIVVFYLSYRLTNIYGIALVEPGHNINLNNVIIGISDVFNQYFGRFAVKNILNGLFVFFTKFDHISMSILILINIIISYFVNIFFLKINIKILNLKLIFYFFLSLFIVSLAPNILNGGTAGRNLIISSIIFSILIFFIFIYFKHKLINIVFLSTFILLIVSQGNALSQAISCRITHSTNFVLNQNKDFILSHDFIIFDKKSFSNEIKHSLVNNPNNIFHNYYSAQMFENWGLRAMFKNIFDDKIDLYISGSNIIQKKEEFLFKTDGSTAYNNISFKDFKLPRNNTIIIDYNFIYPNGFNNGFIK